MNQSDTFSDSPPPNARLVAQQGPERGQTFPIPRGGMVIGRAPECDLALKDNQVSRRHARLFWRGSRLIVEDLGSANGTLVNGMPISQPFLLSEDDSVQLGDSILAVQGLLSRELTPTVRNLDAAVAAASRPPAAPLPQPKPPASRLSWLALAGLPFMGVVMVGLLIMGGLWYFNQPAAVSQLPVVSFVTPANGAQVNTGAPVIVQASASDARGITRVELWVNNSLVSQQTSPAPQGQASLLLNVSWTPPVQGSHVLEVRAFNSANQQNLPAIITVNAAGEAATPTAAVSLPTPTIAPAPATLTPLPTATGSIIIIFTPTPSPLPATPAPSLQAVSDVNVRSGPGTSFQVLGLLRAADSVAVVGRSADGAWWQIIFPPNSGNLGWVVGTYVQPNPAANNVPIAAGPPLPPTATPTPPAPTSTPAPSAEVSFTTDRTELNSGQCTKLRWQVKNVTGYYVDNIAGAGDEGEREVCDPVGTNTHTLRIQRQDGSTQDFTVTITVRPSNNMPKPNLKAPDDEEEFGNGDDVEFDWSSIDAPGTVRYNLEIQYRDNGEWKNWRTLNGLNKSEYKLDDFPDNKSGRWRVWATSSELGDSERTEWRDFDFE